MNSENIVIFEDKNGTVELRADVEKETIWATLNQIADVFDVQKADISKHLKNIFETSELVREATVSKMETVQKEGGRSIKRQIEFYNLDAVIAVGYRVNSKKATQFRIWATRILREYLKNGYNLDQNKLNKSPEKLLGLYEAIAFLESKSLSGKLRGKITFKLTSELDRNE